MNGNHTIGKAAHVKRTLKKLLPGIISGSADNDPAGITTYAVSGAVYGFSQLWLLILSTPMLIAVQGMSARLGDVTRKGLMTVIRERFHPGFIFAAAAALIVSSIATLSADLMAVAQAGELLTGVAWTIFIIPVAVLTLCMMVFEDFRKIEKILFVLSLTSLAYILSALFSGPDWMRVARSLFIPGAPLDRGYVITGLALLGTTITPFLFFWQSREHIEEHENRKDLAEDAKREDSRLAPGFVFSNLISFFIIVSAATVFHNRGITELKSAADVALALEPLVGPYAKILFALGIMGSGLLALPILATSMAYAVAEVFSWRESLSVPVAKAKAFYAVLALAVGSGVVASYLGIDPIKALLYSQVINGILAPLLIIMILRLTNDKAIMGDRINTAVENLLGISTVVIMAGGTAFLLFSL